MIKFIFIFILLCPKSVFAKDITEDIYINSENIFYDKTKETITLGEDSLIDYQGTIIGTNNALINNITKEITMKDKFYINSMDDIMKGDYYKGDLDFTMAESSNVNYLYQNDLKINAKKFFKNNNQITFEDSFITPCDLNGFFNCPTWSLKVKKTFYDSKEDHFRHFGSFIQIADKKVAFIPFFSHYGNKAGRKRGFLTPKMELSNINFGGNFTTPYFIPLKENLEIILTPSFYYETGFSTYFKNTLQVNHLIKGGELALKLDNYIDNRIKDSKGPIDWKKKGLTIAYGGDLVLNKKNKLNIALNYTSNISKFKQQMEEKASTINSTVKLETYDFLRKNDLLVSNFSGTKSLDDTVSNDSNPYETPTFKYRNYFNLKKNISLNNEITFNNITRNKSANYLPEKIIRTTIVNKFQKNYLFADNLKIINKAILNNTSTIINGGNETTNIKSGNSINLAQYFSTEINKIYSMNNNQKIKPRIKLIITSNAKENKLNINDNSQSLSYGYNNIFEENRYFGSDKKENGARIVYGLEHKVRLGKEREININYGRSYNLENNLNFMKEIKQEEKGSDHLFNTIYRISNNHNISYNSRYDNKTLLLKEDILNYEFKSKNTAFALSKTLINTQSFVNSIDSHFLTTDMTRKINNNSNIKYKSEINLINKKIKPYSQNIELNIFDECSNLSFGYAITDYNDGDQVKPNKTFSIEYQLEFLGGSNSANNIF